MNRIGFIFWGIALVMLLGACRSSRHAQRTDVYTGATQQGQETTTVVARNNAQAVTAKLNLSLEAGSQKITLGGTYRLKRNEVIQLNLTYTMLVTVNIGTLELTPDYMLVMDRWNKRYCRVTYDEVPMLAQSGINYAYLERIFWGESTESPTPALTWKYADWSPLGDGQFPGRIQFTVHSGASSYQAIFSLSNLRENSDWETRTEVGANYTPISLDAVVKALMSVAK